MARKNGKELVELKVVQAVLKTEFKNHKEHITKQFDDFKDEVKEQFEKGSKRMEDIEEDVGKNSKFRQQAKAIIGAVGVVAGFMGAGVTWIMGKIWK